MCSCMYVYNVCMCCCCTYGTCLPVCTCILFTYICVHLVRMCAIFLLVDYAFWNEYSASLTRGLTQLVDRCVLNFESILYRRLFSCRVCSTVVPYTIALTWVLITHRYTVWRPVKCHLQTPLFKKDIRLPHPRAPRN